MISVGYSVHTRPYFSTRGSAMPHYLVRLQTEGVCQAMVNGELLSIEPGSLLLCKPGDHYSLMIPLEPHEPPRSADYYMAIAPDNLWIRQWWEHNVQRPLMQLAFDEAHLAIWKQLVYENRRVKDSDPLILEYLTRALLLQIQRMSRSGDQTNPYERSIANKMKMFIERNAADKLSLKDVCASVGLSVSRASQLFKRNMNQSIMDYAIEVRLSMAKERMLTDGVTLNEIAHLSGFANYTHFNRLFKSRFGVAPSQYNKRMKKEK